MEPKLHVHVYDQTSDADDNLVEEFDLKLKDASPDPEGYLQFGAELSSLLYLEVRLSYVDLKRLWNDIETAKKQG